MGLCHPKEKKAEEQPIRTTEDVPVARGAVNLEEEQEFEKAADAAQVDIAGENPEEILLDSIVDGMI